MKKKYTKLAASVSIALTQSINADVDTENVNLKISSSRSVINMEVDQTQLVKTPETLRFQ